VHGHALLVLVFCARLDDKRADVFQVLSKALPPVVDSLVDEEADPCRPFFAPCYWIAEIENILSRVVSGRRVRVPL
jgi:hypothetical protein